MTETDTRTAAVATPPPTAAAAGNGNGNGGTLTTLVSGIIDDAQKLVNQQIQMLKVEVREDFRKSRRAAEYASLGIVLLTVGLLALVTCLAMVLHERYGFSLWASWGLTGLLFTVTGAALAVTSYILLERFNPLPDKTFNALKENITWKTEPQT